jgi:hypothetical protein
MLATSLGPIVCVMNRRGLFFAFLLASCSGWINPVFAADRRSCPVTRPPVHPFVPPAGYSAGAGENEFLYGSSALWTIIYPNWHIHSGGKLPFFRKGYDWMKEKEPRLTVVARRLDRPDPLVWNDPANNAGPSMVWNGYNGKPVDGNTGGFMVTGVDIPSAGCWEIAAHYVQSFDNIQTLTYTVWVEP